MAAVVMTVTTNASSSARDRLPAKTTMQGLIHGDAPITLGNGLKAAFVHVDFDGGDYATGGTDINLLTALPGWTAVLGAVPTWFVDTNPKLASYNPDNDKLQVHLLTGGEHTAAALSGDVTLLVLGY